MNESDRSETLIPAIDTMPADLLTPLAVYLKLSAASENSFLLESVEGGESLGRYSFIGADPHFVARGDHRSTTVIAGSENKVIEQPMFEFLRSHFVDHKVERPEDLPPFVGGAI